jgi:hypothetical protein
LWIPAVFVDAHEPKEPQAVQEPHDAVTGLTKLPAIWTRFMFWDHSLGAANFRDNDFESLADAAWRVAINLPAPVWDLLNPPSRVRTLVNRLWIGQYRRYFCREKILNRVHSQGDPNADVGGCRVPEQDGFVLKGIDDVQYGPQCWLLLVYNLAWSHSNMVLRAERSVWNGQWRFAFNVNEDDLLESAFPSASQNEIPHPIEWMTSKLPCNVFLASVWTIDQLIQQLTDADAPPEVFVVRPNGWTKTELINDVISESTFDRIRAEAAIPSGKSGDHARTYSIAELKILTTIAETKGAGKRYWKSAAKYWRELLIKTENG